MTAVRFVPREFAKRREERVVGRGGELQKMLSLDCPTITFSVGGEEIMARGAQFAVEARQRGCEFLQTSLPCLGVT